MPIAEDLNLRIVGVEPGDTVAGAQALTLRTTRGEIAILLHAAQNPAGAVVCVSGAIGGLDGPAKLYPRLGSELPGVRISVARIDYRAPGEFGECVLDAMAAMSFLKGIGYRRVAIVGHSFGGAVAINAGTLGALVTTVVAISTQLGGAHVVEDLAPRPLLLVHGAADTVLSDEASRFVYAHAREPKTLKIFPGADHGLSQVRDQLFELVRNWIVNNC